MRRRELNRGIRLCNVITRSVRSCVGTIEEIAKTEGVKKETIKFYGTKAYRDRLKNRNTKKARVLILLD